MSRPGSAMSTAETEPLLNPIELSDAQRHRARLRVCDRLEDVDARRDVLEALGLIEAPPTPDYGARRRTAARARRRKAQQARERDEAS